MFCLRVTSKHGKKPCHACHAVTHHRNCSVNTVLGTRLSMYNTCTSKLKDYILLQEIERLLTFVNPASTYYIGTCLCFINIQFVGFEAFRVLIRVMKEVMRFLASFIDMNLSLLAAPVQCFTIAASGWNWNLIPMPKPSGMISVLHIFRLLFYKPYCRRQ